MSYEVFILKRAQRELSHLPIEDYERVKKAISQFQIKSETEGCEEIGG